MSQRWPWLNGWMGIWAKVRWQGRGVRVVSLIPDRRGLVRQEGLSLF